ncbi:hypothetical protein, partial [Neisseria gonorrhoeae]|uniref:hypothetical protein n=1 Tax=Neisseria gonorrhoeae TaxID=485 RepID=UPI00384FE17A
FSQSRPAHHESGIASPFNPPAHAGFSTPAEPENNTNGSCRIEEYAEIYRKDVKCTEMCRI